MHEHMFVHRGPRYSESEAREAIAASFSWSEALRRLGMCHSGGAHLVLRKYAEVWEISTDHFDPYAAVRGSGERSRRPLEEILVEHSTFARNHLKERLYEAGLKQRICELCGQGELWRGRRMGLILDHVNGVSDDNPAREPAHRVPQLRRDVRHPLRAEPKGHPREPVVCSLRSGIPSEVRDTAVLLARVWNAIRARGSPPPRGAPGGATALSAAHARDSGSRLPGDRPTSWRKRQRRSEMGAAVRA